jgi:hypothetical protein
MSETTDEPREPAGSAKPADPTDQPADQTDQAAVPAEPADQTDQPAGRAPTPGAQAASRARRIGGRPLPGPRPSDADGERPTSPRGRSDTAGKAAGAGKAGSPDKDADAAKAAKAERRRRLLLGVPRRGPQQPKQARPPLDPAVFRRRVARTGTVLVVVSSVAVAALLGVGLWLSHGVWWAKTPLDARRNDVRSQVLAAAKSCTAAVLSFDYRSLDNSEQAGKNCSTGQLAKDYTTLMDQTVKKIAPQTKTVQVFQTIKAGVTSVSPDGKQWVVLVFGQESVTNTSTTSGSTSPSPSPSGSSSAAPSSTPRLDISTAEVTLNQVNGRWLLSNMTTTS